MEETRLIELRQWSESSAGMGRGVTVGADGVVWVAQHGGWSNGRLTGYDSESLNIVHDLYLGSRGDIPIGVGIGSGGKIWTNNQRSQNLTAYDPRTGAYGFYPEDVAPSKNLRASLYTYSDFTGNLAKTFTDPEGRYRENVNGCERWAYCQLGTAYLEPDQPSK